MKALTAVLALGVTAGCSGVLRGPDACTEIHFETTYALARWAGWPPEDAAAIAAADAWTDQHGDTTSVATERRVLGGLVNPLTIPRVLTSALGDMLMEGEPPRRAFGRRVAEATAWTVPDLGLRLHFPARSIHAPVTPAFFVNPTTGDLEYGNADARRVLEQAFLDLETRDEDGAATLALLGMGLHTLQDSFKHCGFDGAAGHIGACPDPDTAGSDLGLALRSADATLHSLRYARRLAAGRSASPPPAWKEQLRLVLADGSPDRWTRFFRLRFGEPIPDRDALVERWRTGGGDEAFARAVARARELFR
jgi:hypothetical protein